MVDSTQPQNSTQSRKFKKVIANARIPLTMLRRRNSNHNVLTLKGDETLNKAFLEHKKTLQIDNRSAKFKFSNLLGSSLDEK